MNFHNACSTFPGNNPYKLIRFICFFVTFVSALPYSHFIFITFCDGDFSCSIETATEVLNHTSLLVDLFLMSYHPWQYFLKARGQIVKTKSRLTMEVFTASKVLLRMETQNHHNEWKAPAVLNSKIREAAAETNSEVNKDTILLAAQLEEKTFEYKWTLRPKSLSVNDSKHANHYATAVQTDTSTNYLIHTDNRLWYTVP